MIHGVWLALALTLGTATSAAGGHGATLPSIPLVGSDHVARLLERGEPLFVVDLRTSAEFAAGHIPAAVSMPLEKLEDRLREIPRTRRVLLYCHCPTEEIAGSYALLFRLGYRNHAVLEGGFAAWTARGHPIAR